MPLSPALGRQKQVDLSKLKVNLVHIRHSRPASVHGESCLKNYVKKKILSASGYPINKGSRLS